MADTKAKVEKDIAKTVEGRLNKAKTIEKILSVFSRCSDLFESNTNLTSLVEKRLEAEVKKLNVKEKVEQLLSMIESKALGEKNSWAVKKLESEVPEIEKFCSEFHYFETMRFLKSIAYEKELGNEFRVKILSLLEKEIKKITKDQKPSQLETFISHLRSSEADALIKKWAEDNIAREVKLLAPRLHSQKSIDQFYGFSRQPGKFISGRMETELSEFIGYTEDSAFCEAVESVLKYDLNLREIPKHKILKLTRFLDKKCRPEFKEYLLSSVKEELEKIVNPLERVNILVAIPSLFEALWVEINKLKLSDPDKFKLLLSLKQRCHDASIQHIDSEIEKLLEIQDKDSFRNILFGISEEERIEVLKGLISKRIDEKIFKLSKNLLEYTINDLESDLKWRESFFLLEDPRTSLMKDYGLRVLREMIDDLTYPESIGMLITIIGSDMSLGLQGTGLIERAIEKLKKEMKDQEPEENVNLWENYIYSDKNQDIKKYAIIQLKEALNKLDPLDKSGRLINYIFDSHEFGDEFFKADMFSLFKDGLSKLDLKNQVESLRLLLDHEDEKIKEFSVAQFKEGCGKLDPQKCIEILGGLSEEERKSFKSGEYKNLVFGTMKRMDIIGLANYALVYRQEFHDVDFYEMVLDHLKTRLGNKITTNQKLLEASKCLSNPKRILFLQKCAIACEPQEMKSFALQLLGKDIEGIEKMLVGRNKNDFQALLNAATESMHLFFMDGCSDADEIKRVALLKSVSAFIGEYFKTNESSMDEAAKILAVLSNGNLTLSYSYPWQHLSKNDIFSPIVSQLLEKLDDSLVANKICSFEALSNVSDSLRNHLWREMKVPTGLVGSILKKANSMFLEGMPCSEEEAFKFLDGFTDLRCKEPDFGNHGQFIAELAKVALPILNRHEGPFKCFRNESTFVNSRIARILQIIPQVNFSINPKLFNEVTSNLTQKYGSAEYHEILSALPDKMVPNKELMLALYDIQPQIPDFSSRESERTENLELRRADGKHVRSLSTFRRALKLMHLENNTRGLTYFFNNFSGQISTWLKGRVGLRAEDIESYLKILRKSVLDISSPEAVASINLLCKEALTYPEKVTPKMALDLLWLNMVLSVCFDKEGMSYTKKEQEMLFMKFNDLNAVNTDQARMLFEIKTMEWHGGEPFDEKILTKMKQHFENFKKGSNPSKTEELYFLGIKKHLINSSVLYHDYICPKTGHEVDIAFVLDNKKVAINIEGPDHYDPVTHQRTIKTIFRDKCLEKAGWDPIIEVDLLRINRADYESKYLEIAKVLNSFTPVSSVVPLATKQIQEPPSIPVITLSLKQPEPAQKSQAKNNENKNVPIKNSPATVVQNISKLVVKLPQSSASSSVTHSGNKKQSPPVKQAQPKNNGNKHAPVKNNSNSVSSTTPSFATVPKQALPTFSKSHPGQKLPATQAQHGNKENKAGSAKKGLQDKNKK